MNSHAASWRLSSRVRTAQPSMTRPLAAIGEGLPEVVPRLHVLAIERPANTYCDAGPLSSDVDTQCGCESNQHEHRQHETNQGR